MAKANFITTEYFKSNEIVDGNYSDDKISKTIYNQQRIYIRKYLSEPLYYHLMAAIDGNTLTSEEVLLLDDYIAPLLSKLVYYTLKSTLSTLTNKGSNVRTDENSTPVDIGYFKTELAAIKNDINILKDDLAFYLRENKADFPTYNDYNDPSFQKDAIKPTQSSGIFYPRNHYQCNDTTDCNYNLIKYLDRLKW